MIAVAHIRPAAVGLVSDNLLSPSSLVLTVTSIIVEGQVPCRICLHVLGLPAISQ